MWDFINHKEVVGRKAHRCDECRCDLPIGTRHIYVAGKTEGELMDYRPCLECRLITHEAVIVYFEEGFPLGDTRQELREEYGIEDALAWATAHRAARKAAKLAEAVVPSPMDPAAQITALRKALAAVSLIRPSNWADDDDPEQVAAWRAVDAALEATQ